MRFVIEDLHTSDFSLTQILSMRFKKGEKGERYIILQPLLFTFSTIFSGLWIGALSVQDKLVPTFVTVDQG